MDEQFTIIRRALDKMVNEDIFAAMTYLRGLGEPLDVLAAYDDLVKHLYWQENNLPAVVALSRAGIQYGLSAAADSVPDQAARIKSKARAMAYNLASFTWPGWDEPGIDTNRTDLALGLDAAKTSLRILIELEGEPLPLCRGCWILGAHQLASGDSVGALKSFAKSAEYALQADNQGEALLAQGFAILARMQANLDEGQLKDDLSRVQAQLLEQEHGADFNEQINTAARVFNLL